MVKFLRDYGFFLFLGIFVLLFLSCITLISLAPHDDTKMRGFTPCTYQIAEKMMTNGTLKQSEVFGIIAKGYGCYFKVIGEGIKLFYKGQQSTPWANYLFTPDSTISADEGFDADLEQNSLLKDDDEIDLLDNEIKESIDE